MRLPEPEVYVLPESDWKPPEDIVEMLADTHPAVQLAYDPFAGRWVLWQRRGAKWRAIHRICGPDGEFAQPTLDNTVRHLNFIDPRRIVNQWDLDQWLYERCDEPEVTGAEALRKKHEPQIRAGSDRLYDSLIGKVRVPRA